MPSRPHSVETDSPKDRLAGLYERMEQAYDQVADRIGLSCSHCLDNCCTSYFQHHTYIEWAYLWSGLETCSPSRRQAVQEKAQAYVQATREALAADLKPGMMCPLNQDGWCDLYAYRMMICRLHGVPNRVRMPDGQTREFPGCATTQQLVSGQSRFPALDRTPFYVELAQLEREFLSSGSRSLPRVKLTLAEMIVQGPPPIKFD